MGKIAEANTRMFKNVFICKNCSAKIRANPLKVLARKVKCRKCKKTAFRQIKKR